MAVAVKGSKSTGLAFNLMGSATMISLRKIVPLRNSAVNWISARAKPKNANNKRQRINVGVMGRFAQVI